MGLMVIKIREHSLIREE